MTKTKHFEQRFVNLQVKELKNIQNDLFFQKETFLCIFKSDEIDRNVKLQLKFSELYCVYVFEERCLDGCNINILQLWVFVFLFSPLQTLGWTLFLVLVQTFNESQ